MQVKHKLASWVIVQLTEDGEVTPHEVLIREIGRVFPKGCSVFFPYKPHPKLFFNEVSMDDFPLCAYIFILCANQEDTMKLRNTALFVGPLVESKCPLKFATVSSEELKQIQFTLKKEVSVIPRLGAAVTFKIGKYRGIPATIVGKSGSTVKVDTYLRDIRIVGEVDISLLAQEESMRYNLIIDAMNLYYRSHYALGNLSTSAGFRTGGIYGFINALLRLKKGLKIDNVFVVWDNIPTEKKAKCAEYKAKRSHHEDNSKQLRVLYLLLSRLGVFQIQSKNQEADDVIASLISQELTEDINYIYSNDDDFLQLVRDGHVAVLKPVQGGQEQAYDEEAVRRKYGIPPKLLPFYRAIKGDTSDNLKGVPRINTKRLVSYFCNKINSSDLSLDTVLTEIAGENTNHFTKGEKQKFSEFSPVVRLNYDLMKLRTDLPYSSDYGELDINYLESAFRRLEFRSLEGKVHEIENDFKPAHWFFKTN